ncbi:MAG: hypothetical protein ACE5JX_04715 [Acidobacteriota bacterium]
MKGKISATITTPLMEFLDSLPGRTRSEKLERILARYKQFHEDEQLRRELGNYREDEQERAAREAWERTVSEAMWNE